MTLLLSILDLLFLPTSVRLSSVLFCILLPKSNHATKECEFLLCVILMDNDRYHKDYERIASEGNCGDHVFTMKNIKEEILKVIVRTTSLP